MCLDGTCAGHRVDMFVICEPGTYQLQTGQGPLSVDPGCGSSHCELLNQTTLATLQVVCACPASAEIVHLAPCHTKRRPLYSSAVGIGSPVMWRGLVDA